MLAVQWVLRTTKLDEGYVALLLGMVILLSAVVLVARPSSRIFRRSFILACISGYATLLVLWLVNFELYWLILRDHHVVEWLTTHFLLVGAVLGFAIVTKNSRRRDLWPIAGFLAAGRGGGLQCRPDLMGEVLARVFAPGSGLRAPGSGLRAPGCGLRAAGTASRVSGFGFGSIGWETRRWP